MLRDGTLIISGTAKTLYFRPVTIRFLRGTRHHLFSHAERTLEQALKSPAFTDVKPLFIQDYLRYLPLRLGPVTEKLRRKNDPLYRQLLNRYGDEDFTLLPWLTRNRDRRKGSLLYTCRENSVMLLAAMQPLQIWLTVPSGISLPINAIATGMKLPAGSTALSLRSGAPRSSGSTNYRMTAPSMSPYPACAAVS